MKNIKHTLRIIVLLGITFNFQLLTFNCEAQDIHFSQFDSSPLNLNPANTGIMKADYRVVANNRTQWSSVSSPFATYSFSYDMHLLKKPERNSYFGIGFVAFTDKAGSSNFKTSLYAISLASILKINDINWLSLGLQGGFGQKSLSTTNLTWDNQFANGAFNSNLASGETSIGKQVNYADISAGMALNGGIENQVEYQIGGAYFHANQPNVSFTGLGEKKLSAKIVFHGKMRIKLRRIVNKPDAFLVPKFWYIKQGGHQEIYIGTLYEFIVKSAAKYTTYGNKVKFGIGGYYRVGDAFIVATNFDYGHINIGLSYDINISQFSTASSYRGGLELSFIFKNVFKTELIKLKK